MQQLEATLRDLDESQLQHASNWNCFIFGVFNIKEVLQHVNDASWQRTRLSMLNTSLRVKFETLYCFLLDNNFNDHAKICVTNYVNALKRGGLIK